MTHSSYITYFLQDITSENRRIERNTWIYKYMHINHSEARSLINYIKLRSCTKETNLATANRRQQCFYCYRPCTSENNLPIVLTAQGINFYWSNFKYASNLILYNIRKLYIYHTTEYYNTQKFKLHNLLVAR